LIGLSAVLLMALHGRIAGINGILGGVVPLLARDWPWRVAFLAGSIAAPLLLLASGRNIPFDVPVSMPLLAVGGFIVGIGATLANGCPSGHGICGMARLSPRSFAAVATFMLTAFVTVFISRHVMGA
jgi:uncharacterized membrane protein YedE/YeeE